MDFSRTCQFRCLWGNCPLSFTSYIDLCDHVQLFHLGIPCEWNGCNFAIKVSDDIQQPGFEHTTPRVNLVKPQLLRGLRDHVVKTHIPYADFSEHEHGKRICNWRGCGSSFTGKLQQHILTHVPVREHYCIGCTYSSKRRQDLDRHMSRCLHVKDVQQFVKVVAEYNVLTSEPAYASHTNAAFSAHSCESGVTTLTWLVTATSI
ncbi:hypothetical protein K474DRAFT_124766 [Panus rudis PR-1116 ss-1]|nr:hypothetical protein K474DRAFT_124766 [Panus rudis PR-1116 ss-1]